MSGLCDTCKRSNVCRKPIGGVDSCRRYVRATESNYEKLFGTPERAAEYFAMQCFGSDGGMCYYCPFDDCDERLCNMGAYPTVYDKLLEWLRGDAE